jgi:hypothetical protein
LGVLQIKIKRSFTRTLYSTRFFFSCGSIEFSGSARFGSTYTKADIHREALHPHRLRVSISISVLNLDLAPGPPHKEKRITLLRAPRLPFVQTSARMPPATRKRKFSDGEEVGEVKKYYAVRKGFRPGVFTNWEDCQEQTTGFKGAMCEFLLFCFFSWYIWFCQCYSTGGVVVKEGANVKIWTQTNRSRRNRTQKHL